MASTSGSVYGNNVDGSEGSYLDWQLASQNASGNYSVINWQAGWRFSTSSCRGLRLGEAYIDGATVYYNHNGGDGVHGYVSGHNHKPKLQTASGQITVNHNGDRTKSFNASVTMTGYSGLLSSGNAWFDLPSLATTPPAPNFVSLSQITSTSMVAFFTGNGDGGSPILEWRIGYGTDPSYPQFYNATGGTSTITGLTPGTQYYFWSQGRNALGWGSWSPRNSATTLRIPDAPSSPVISEITQVSAVATFNPNGDGGAVITAYEIGYTTNTVTTGQPIVPQTIIPATSPQMVSGLNPGTTYGFLVRAKNSVGWSAWSSVTTAKTIAGARINVGNVWKDAIPYVNVNGVWKVARPWGRTAGVWKETM